MLKELGELLGPHYPDAWQIYRETIRRGDRTVVVGPSHSLLRDPSSAHISYLVGPEGLVCFADPLFTGEETGPGRQTKAGTPRSAGGVLQLVGELSDLRSLGIPLGSTEYLGLESGIFNIPLESGSVDAVVDHHTSVYLARWEYVVQKENFRRGAFFEKVFREYSRVLRPGGKILFQTDFYGMSGLLGYSMVAIREMITERLAKVGVDSSIYKVVDRYKLPAKREQYLLFVKLLKDKYGERENNTSKMYFDPGSGTITFTKPYWESPDMVIGTKRVRLN